jgi:Family of unknown function (DUF5906)/NrS-1  polymerase HBD domain
VRAAYAAALRAAFSPGGSLHALAGSKRFFTYKLVWNEERQKNDKQPYSHSRESLIDLTNPANLTDWETALTSVEKRGESWLLGRSFLADEKFLFLDLDKCIAADGTMTGVAATIYPEFKKWNAAIERSSSEKGLHIFAAYTGDEPDHLKKVEALGIELYTDGRGCAFGTPLEGNAGTDCTRLLNEWLIPNYFPPRTISTNAQWSDAKIDPACDDALLKRAKYAREGADIAFGTAISFSDLFNGDKIAIQRAYPGLSEAEYGLAFRLAFWTARDCEQIRRIMLKSGMKRDKWNTKRGSTDYLCYTIMNAVADHIALDAAVYKNAPAAHPLTDATTLPTRHNAVMYPPDQQAYFAGCVWVQSIDRVFYQGDMLDSSRFDVIKGGYMFVMDLENSKETKSAWECFTRSRGVTFPRVKSTCFRPELAAGTIIEEEGETLINSYWPVTTLCIEGDVSPFTKHLDKLLPNEHDRDIVVSYMAALVQYPGVKFQWCPLIQGAPGNGKTLILEVMEKIIGARYAHRPNAKDLDNKFTAWIDRRLLIGVEEIRIGARHDMLEVLKPLITNCRVEIQAKGQDQVTGDNRANFLMFSNFKDAVLKHEDDRRYAIFFTAQQSMADIERDGMGGDYFPKLYAWIRNGSGAAFVHNWLKNYVIPAHLNPAYGLHRSPHTTSTNEAMAVSLGTAEQLVLEAIDSDAPGFRGGIVSSIAVSTLLTNNGIRLSPGRRKDMLASLKLFTHPALGERGRVDNALGAPDNGKPYLFVRKDSRIAALNKGDLVAMYVGLNSPFMPHQEG